MDHSGRSPDEKLELLASRYDGLSRWYKWNGNEIWCDICGKIFESQGALNFHKSSFHFNNSAAANDNVQWDFGQLDLQNGVNCLWNDFMHEHDLQKVCFLYGDEHVFSRFNDDYFMPFYYCNKLKDEMTGQMHDAICFNDNWLRLDADAKIATIAHTAAHLENARRNVNDVAFNKKRRHTKEFRNVAVTYDLLVSNVPDKGFAMTVLTDKFRNKHKYAVKLINRYHYMKEFRGTRQIHCDIER